MRILFETIGDRSTSLNCSFTPNSHWIDSSCTLANILFGELIFFFENSQNNHS
ncbi:hypothetical protein PUN4_910015 [Paraburkholderia unamae]|nr:hypothetical protein PUN4_910015 [Paraburkholderia unamae]